MKRFLTLLLCVAMMAGCAVLLGCEKDVGGGEDITDSETTLQKETEPPAPPSIELAVDGETAYKVICSEDSDTDVTEFSNELCRYLSEISGAQFRLISDFAGRKADPDAVSEYEILIGGTNRTADDSSLE